ncbi:MAG: hypothetical protein ABR949_10165 [Candidatus Aquilonibacter sp.]|jgi:hypothetical protein
MTALPAKPQASLAEEYGVSPRELALLAGDLSQLSQDERTNLYAAICSSLGLNPLTRPFEYIMLSGKLTLYARKDCTEQLRKKHGISVEIVAREHVADCYVVTAQAAMPSGRVDESIGAVPIGNLKGESLANALMKAETKAKRRVTLSIAGLGMLDETEMETIPAKAKKDVASQPALPPPPGPDALADAIARAHALGAIPGPTRDLLTAWADEHGLLVQGRLTPTALGKIIAALDAAENSMFSNLAQQGPPPEDVASSADEASVPSAASSQTEAAPVEATSAVFHPEPEPDPEAEERQKKALRQRMGILATEIKMPDERRRFIMRQRYGQFYADVKHGDESSKALPLAYLRDFVDYLETLKTAYNAKKVAKK